MVRPVRSKGSGVVTFRDIRDASKPKHHNKGSHNSDNFVVELSVPIYFGNNFNENVLFSVFWWNPDNCVDAVSPERVLQAQGEAADCWSEKGRQNNLLPLQSYSAFIWIYVVYVM